MYDRSAKQDVVYRQVSIKPGLVGLRGAWISGGIEWDFPRSHSVTTFDTVSCQFVRHDDGSGIHCRRRYRTHLPHVLDR